MFNKTLFLLDLDLVECSTTIDCTNSDLGIMTTRDCCIDNPNGLSYTIPGSEVCYVCVGKLIYILYSNDTLSF